MLLRRKCISSLVKLCRDESETLKSLTFIPADHTKWLINCFCGRVLMEGAETFHRR